MSKYQLLFIALILLGMQLQAAEFSYVDHAPIHEAFADRVSDSVLLDAIPHAPPAPLKEKVSQQSNPFLKWIPGYWAWIETKNDFIWVSGTWRRPPPEREWVSGTWKQSDEGWFWIPGFWSADTFDRIKYIAKSPPEASDEQADEAPDDDYFWMSGFWNYVEEKNDFVWIAGRWERLDPEWIYIPAYYVWRPEGYVLVTEHWDWPLDKRGKLYAPIQIPISQATQFDYSPERSLETDDVVQNLFTAYPNYLTVFQHHYHYHPDYWKKCDCSPPWWNWDLWWTYSWVDQWGLAWWYTHPGYPQPEWLSTNDAALIHHPSEGILRAFKSATPPQIVTSKGVITPKNLEDALFALDGKNRLSKQPILPANKKRLNDIKDRAIPESFESRKILIPTAARQVDSKLSVRPYQYSEQQFLKQKQDDQNRINQLQQQQAQQKLLEQQSYRQQIQRQNEVHMEKSTPLRLTEQQQQQMQFQNRLENLEQQQRQNVDNRQLQQLQMGR